MKTNPEHPNVAEILVFRERIEENTDLIRSMLPTDFMLLFSLEGQDTVSRGSKVTLERHESQPVTPQDDK